jgi:hypothetical protein
MCATDRLAAEVFIAGVAQLGRNHGATPGARSPVVGETGWGVE